MSGNIHRMKRNVIEIFGNLCQGFVAEKPTGIHFKEVNFKFVSHRTFQEKNRVKYLRPTSERFVIFDSSHQSVLIYSRPPDSHNIKKFSLTNGVKR